MPRYVRTKRRIRGSRGYEGRRYNEFCESTFYQVWWNKVCSFPSWSIRFTEQGCRSIENPIALEKKRSITVTLQDNALLILLLLGQKCGTCGMFEDFTDTLIGLCWALKVLVCANLLTDFLTLDYHRQSWFRYDSIHRCVLGLSPMLGEDVALPVQE